LNDTEGIKRTDGMLNDTEGIKGTDGMLNDTEGIKRTDGMLNDAEGIKGTDGALERNQAMQTRAMTPEQAHNYCKEILDEIEKAVIGKRGVLEEVMMSILTGGHILFEDFPGLAKTLMANSFARVLGCDFKRIQFTPDLLPSDITGTYVYNPKKNEFEFNRGPVFTNILLADEINRAPPKTQAALLEAMQEGQVTIEGVTHKLPQPFIVFATQNPIEYEGTYPLPEAQLDRFMVKLSVGYPTPAEESEIIARREERKVDDVYLSPIVDAPTVRGMQHSIEEVYIDPRIIDYLVDIVQRTRGDPRVMVGTSPRGSISLYKLSKARSLLERRDYVIPDDVKMVAVPAMKHRIILKPEPKIRGVLPENIVSGILSEAYVPTAAQQYETGEVVV